jgi:hypothetical protein
MMKKSIFTLAFLALVAFASAQTLQFELDGRVFANNEVYICPSEPNMTGELAQEMQLRNLTNQTLSVVVMKEEIQMVPGTENSFCWGSCYDPTVTISRPNELEGNSVSLAGLLSFHHQIDPTYSGDPANFLVGTSIVRYYAYPSDDPDNAICLEMWFAYGAEGIDENQVVLGHAYPNPASSVVRFNYELPSVVNASVSVYNLLGQEVMSQDLNSLQGQAVLSVADLTEGIYFCNLKVDGRTVRTEKFIVRK